MADAVKTESAHQIMKYIKVILDGIEYTVPAPVAKFMQARLSGEAEDDEPEAPKKNKKNMVPEKESKEEARAGRKNKSKKDLGPDDEEDEDFMDESEFEKKPRKMAKKNLKFKPKKNRDPEEEDLEDEDEDGEEERKLSFKAKAKKNMERPDKKRGDSVDERIEALQDELRFLRKNRAPMEAKKQDLRVYLQAAKVLNEDADELLSVPVRTLKRRVINELRAEADLSNKSDAYIDGRFDAAIEEFSENESKSYTDILSRGAKAVFDSKEEGMKQENLKNETEEAQKKYVDDRRDAWKKEMPTEEFKKKDRLQDSRTL